MKNTFKKVMSLVLTLVMMVSLLPVDAFADTGLLQFTVTFAGNAPSGYTASNVPNSISCNVGGTVTIPSDIPQCKYNTLSLYRVFRG